MAEKQWVSIGWVLGKIDYIPQINGPWMTPDKATYVYKNAYTAIRAIDKLAATGHNITNIFEVEMPDEIPKNKTKHDQIVLVQQSSKLIVKDLRCNRYSLDLSDQDIATAVEKLIAAGFDVKNKSR